MNSENRGVPLWIIITIALAVSLLSISGYDYLNKRYERQATREIAECHQQEKDSAAAEAVRNERLQQAIISVSGIQTGIAEYLADKGETPPNLEAIGFVSDYRPSNLLESVSVQPGGRIVLHFTAKSGLNGEVSLQADIDKEYWAIRGWDCTSSDFPSIANARHDCRYLPR